MSWTMPQPPDQLINLLRRQSPMAPAGAVPPSAQPTSTTAGPLPYGPQPTPQTVASNQQIEGGGQPSTPAAQSQSPAQPATPSPAPSDDPAISGQPKTPDLTSYLNPAMARMNDLMAKRAAVPAVDPNQVKPKLWERLLGVALGATQLKNPENAGAVAGQVVNRRLIGAERARNLALEPIDEQIKAEREAFPLYTAAGEAAYHQGELGQGQQRINEDVRSHKATEQIHTDLADIRQQVASNNLQTAHDRLEEQARALETNSGLKQQMINNQGQALDIRNQMMQLQNDLKQKQLDQEKEKYQAGNSVKSLEDERKARLTAIENDWKQHPYLNKLFGDKNKDIKVVNDEINQRLQGVSASTGTAKSQAPATGGTPQTHVFSKSGYLAANPKGNVEAAAAAAKKHGYEVGQ